MKIRNQFLALLLPFYFTHNKTILPKPHMSIIPWRANLEKLSAHRKRHASNTPQPYSYVQHKREMRKPHKKKQDS